MSGGNLESTLISILSRARGEDAEAGVPLEIREGMARTVLRFGVDRLMGSAENPEIVEASALAAYEKGEKLCESPIERLVLAGLITHPWGWCRGLPLVHDATSDQVLRPWDLSIVPQARFLRHRLDFALVAEWGGAQHVIAVECDGAEFHKGIADHERDLYLASWGIPSFHLSGSSIVRDVHEALWPVGRCLSMWNLEKVADLRLPATDIGKQRLGWL